MDDRYSRDLFALSEAEQQRLARQRVLVVGCGGLGGYLIEYLTRVGVGEITAVDGDRFERSNLNRQILSVAANQGKSKVQAARERAEQINPAIRFFAVEDFFNAGNGDELVRGQNLVLDGLDSVPPRLLLEKICARHKVTLIHGAVRGWRAQVAVVPPGSGMLRQLYGGDSGVADKTCLAFTPGLCAAIQASEAVKLLCGRGASLPGRVVTVDLEQLDWNIFSL